MGRGTWFDMFKDAVGWIAWRVFLWSKNKTDEEYWGEIYEAEKIHLEQIEAEKDVRIAREIGGTKFRIRETAKIMSAVNRVRE